MLLMSSLVLYSGCAQSDTKSPASTESRASQGPATPLDSLESLCPASSQTFFCVSGGKHGQVTPDFEYHLQAPENQIRLDYQFGEVAISSDGMEHWSVAFRPSASEILAVGYYSSPFGAARGHDRDSQQGELRLYHESTAYGTQAWRESDFWRTKVLDLTFDQYGNILLIDLLFEIDTLHIKAKGRVRFVEEKRRPESRVTFAALGQTPPTETEILDHCPAQSGSLLCFVDAPRGVVSGERRLLTDQDGKFQIIGLSGGYQITYLGEEKFQITLSPPEGELLVEQRYSVIPRQQGEASFELTSRTASQGSGHFTIRELHLDRTGRLRYIDVTFILKRGLATTVGRFYHSTYSSELARLSEEERASADAWPMTQSDATLTIEDVPALCPVVEPFTICIISEAGTNPILQRPRMIWTSEEGRVGLGRTPGPGPEFWEGGDFWTTSIHFYPRSGFDDTPLKDLFGRPIPYAQNPRLSVEIVSSVGTGLEGREFEWARDPLHPKGATARIQITHGSTAMTIEEGRVIFSRFLTDEEGTLRALDMLFRVRSVTSMAESFGRVYLQFPDTKAPKADEGEGLIASYRWKAPAVKRESLG